MQAAGDRLARCELPGLEPAVIAFADAIRDTVRQTHDADLLSLADAAVAKLRRLAHHVDRQVDAHREAELMGNLLLQASKELARDKPTTTRATKA